MLLFACVGTANAAENPLQERLELMERMKYGFIDKTGEFIIEAQYEFADHFINGVARVRRGKGDDWLFIDKNNNVVKQPSPDIKDAKIVNRISTGNGWIVSKKDDGSTRLAIIDNDGKPLSKFDYLKIEIEPSDTGHMIATYPDRKGCAFINDQGHKINDQIYDRCGPFNQGLAKVVKNNKVGFLKSDGQMAIPFKFDGKYDLTFTISHKGLIPVKEDKVFGYIDRAGDWVIPPKYSYAGSFSEGFARISYLNEKGKEEKGVIDQNGQLIFTHSYSKTGMAFHNGLLSFQENGNWGFVDTAGTVVIPAIFPGGGTGTYFGPDFSEGLVDVGPSDEYQRGYINTSGEYSIPPILNDASPFKDGIARVLALPTGLREAVYIEVLEDWNDQNQE